MPLLPFLNEFEGLVYSSGPPESCGEVQDSAGIQGVKRERLSVVFDRILESPSSSAVGAQQSDRIGIKLLDEIGADNIMWGSDFPHPDGIWPDSQEYIERELGHLPAEVRHKIVCGNAAKLYGFKGD